MKKLMMAVVAAVSLSGFGAEYWVSTTGGGAGTSKDDPMSLTAALAAANAAGQGGDVIHVAAGTYQPSATIKLDYAVTLEGADRDTTIFDFKSARQGFVVSNVDAKLCNVKIINAKNTSSNGGGAYLTDGLVSNCWFNACSVEVGSKGGGGIYVGGGCAVDCKVTGCFAYASNWSIFGGSIAVVAGEARRCDVSGITRKNLATSIVHVGGTGILADSNIHDNGDLTSHRGIALSVVDGGLAYNCLVCRNKTVNFSWENDTTKPLSAGVSVKGGTVAFCTVYGNVVNGDTTGISGLQSNGGTVINCIFWGNGPSSSTAGSCKLRGETAFSHNVIDNESLLVSYPDNMCGDPWFVDAAAGDFHILSRDSAAVKVGATSVDGIPTDIEGNLRHVSKPTAGCYELLAEDFDVDIRFPGQPEAPIGEPVRAEAVVKGASSEDCTYEWYLDGGVDPIGHEMGVDLTGLGLGKHTLRLVAQLKTGGDPAEKSLPDGITVYPLTVYVNQTGSGTYPYATPDTATNSVAEAIKAVWHSSPYIGTVRVAEGSYADSSSIQVPDRVAVVGAGRGATRFSCLYNYAFTLNGSASSVSSLTVTNSANGIHVVQGTVFDCHVVDCDDSKRSAMRYGGGIFLESGLAYDCLIERVKFGSGSPYACGAGIAICKDADAGAGVGIVSNCTVRNCLLIRDGSHVHGHGAYVYGTNKRLTHCTIEKNGLSETVLDLGHGGALSAQSGAVIESCRIVGNAASNDDTIYLASATARNCLFADNASVGTAVILSGSTLENCTIAGVNGAATSVSVDGTSKVYNSILSTVGGAYSFAVGATVEHSCCSALEEGVNGNTAKDPEFKNVAKGDYRLKDASPCVNVGDNARWEGRINPQDLDGGPRIRYGIVDMGCYEKILGMILLFQ